MGTSKSGKGKINKPESPSNAKSPADVKSVRNVRRQPVELRLLGIWYRWEPAGMEGDTVFLPSAATKTQQFTDVKDKYFNVNES